MIEFRMKALYPGHKLDSWEPLNHPEERTLMDFEFSYCEYRIGDEVFTELSPIFIDHLNRIKFWSKLRD